MSSQSHRFGEDPYVSRRSRRLKIVLLSILGLWLLGALTVLYLLTSRPAPAWEPAMFSSPEERNALAYQLEHKVQAFEQAVRQPSPSPRVMLVEQSEINAYLQASPKVHEELRKKGISNPAVRVEQGRITVAADVLFRGMKVPVTVTGKSSVSDGRAYFQLESFRAGRMKMPQKITRELASAVDEAIKKGELSAPPGIDEVRLEDGKLIIISQAQNR